MTTASSRKVRLGVINTHPIQYVAPLLRRINETTDIEAIPIYLTDFSLRGAVDPQFGHKVVWDIDLLTGTDPVFVPGYQTRTVTAGAFAMPAPQIWNIVRKSRLDALLPCASKSGFRHLFDQFALPRVCAICRDSLAFRGSDHK